MKLNRRSFMPAHRGDRRSPAVSEPAFAQYKLVWRNRDAEWIHPCLPHSWTPYYAQGGTADYLTPLINESGGAGGRLYKIPLADIHRSRQHIPARGSEAYEPHEARKMRCA